MNKCRKVFPCTGGGGVALPAQLGVEDNACTMSNQNSFGKSQATPVARNI